jgi:hypothetical protein
VERYENGSLGTVDIEMMSYMSDAVLPYLYELAENAPDEDVRAEAKNAIKHPAPGGCGFEYSDGYRSSNESYISFELWNLQSARVHRLIEQQK